MGSAEPNDKLMKITVGCVFVGFSLLSANNERVFLDFVGEEILQSP